MKCRFPVQTCRVACLNITGACGLEQSDGKVRWDLRFGRERPWGAIAACRRSNLRFRRLRCLRRCVDGKAAPLSDSTLQRLDGIESEVRTKSISIRDSISGRNIGTREFCLLCMDKALQALEKAGQMLDWE